MYKTQQSIVGLKSVIRHFLTRLISWFHGQLERMFTITFPYMFSGQHFLSFIIYSHKQVNVFMQVLFFSVAMLFFSFRQENFCHWIFHSSFFFRFLLHRTQDHILRHTSFLPISGVCIAVIWISLIELESPNRTLISWYLTCGTLTKRNRSLIGPKSFAPFIATSSP